MQRSEHTRLPLLGKTPTLQDQVAIPGMTECTQFGKSAHRRLTAQALGFAYRDRRSPPNSLLHRRTASIRSRGPDAGAGGGDDTIRRATASASGSVCRLSLRCCAADSARSPPVTSRCTTVAVRIAPPAAHNELALIRLSASKKHVAETQA